MERPLPSLFGKCDGVGEGGQLGGECEVSKGRRWLRMGGQGDGPGTRLD